MKWIVYEASWQGETQVWWAKPLYNDYGRPRKPGLNWVKIATIPTGQTEITVDTLVDGVSKAVKTTLGGLFVDGESVYQDTDTEYLMRYRDLLIADADSVNSPLTADMDYHVIEDTDFPADHVCGRTCEFRNVFQWDGSKVAVDMPKARGVHMDVIRRARNTELAAKDITFMRAVEAGDASVQSTIATEKQVLRDIPQTFDLTTDTPEQLKALWPTELPARE